MNLPYGNLAYAEQHGKIRLGKLILTNVLYIPKLKCHLLSLSQLVKTNNCAVSFVKISNSSFGYYLGIFLEDSIGMSGMRNRPYYFRDVEPAKINKASGDDSKIGTFFKFSFTFFLI